MPNNREGWNISSSVEVAYNPGGVNTSSGGPLDIRPANSYYAMKNMAYDIKRMLDLIDMSEVVAKRVSFNNIRRNKSEDEIVLSGVIIHDIFKMGNIMNNNLNDLETNMKIILDALSETQITKPG